MEQQRVLRIFYLAQPTGRAGLALLLLRVLVGIAFIFHGCGKAADITAFAAEFAMPYAVAVLAAYAQLIAGALLVAGLGTPLAALTIAGTMAVATLKLIGRGEPFISPHGHSYEASLFYLIASVTLALLGPGAYSLDASFLKGFLGTAYGDSWNPPHHGDRWRAAGER